LIERLRQAGPLRKYIYKPRLDLNNISFLPNHCYGHSLSPGVRALRKSTVGAALPTKEETMIRTLTFAAVSAAVLLLSPIAFAQQTGGTADEAKAMLIKAVAAVKADKAKALDTFNKGEGGFLDRDLYVFCADLTSNKQTTNGNPNAKALIGTDLREAKDANGKAFGAEILDGMKKPEGVVTEIHYVFPKPGPDKTPVPKVSLVTKVSDDLGCGVGYYKQQ
jgi:hypothetical protein